MAATLEQLRGLMDDTNLTGKIEAAVAIAAEAIRVEAEGVTNHPNRVKWAKKVLSPGARLESARAMQVAIIARYATLNAEDIMAATDAQIKTAVADAVNVFADGT